MMEENSDELRQQDRKLLKREYETETKTKTGIRVGKDGKLIDPDDVYRLAKLWCSYTEIADYFDISINTLKYNFLAEIKRARAETKQALRRAQLKNALNGNVTMQIWLGKQMLGQQEHPLNEDENERLKDILPSIVKRVARKENEDDNS